MVSRADTTDPAASRGFPGLVPENPVLHARRHELALLELNPHALSADKARALLRKLRDLNLSTGPVAITREMAVFLGGCLSLDFPAETGVRYRVRTTDGREGLLELLWGTRGLELSATGPQPFAPRARLRVPLRQDHLGRAVSHELGARVLPETSDHRELEHFLRRVVRTLFRA